MRLIPVGWILLQFVPAETMIDRKFMMPVLVSSNLLVDAKWKGF